jgi:uncharacterized membrane protein
MSLAIEWVTEDGSFTDAGAALWVGVILLIVIVAAIIAKASE